MIKKVCKTCGQPFEISPYRMNTALFCSYKCKRHSPATKNKIGASLAGRHISPQTEFKKGKPSRHWKGGRRMSRGYVQIFKPKHPFVDRSGYVFEHRLIMEQKLRRYLRPEEVIHHINGIKNDNRIENLLLLPSNSSHRILERSPKANLNFLKVKG